MSWPVKWISNVSSVDFKLIFTILSSFSSNSVSHLPRPIYAQDTWYLDVVLIHMAHFCTRRPAFTPYSSLLPPCISFPLIPKQMLSDTKLHKFIYYITAPVRSLVIPWFSWFSAPGFTRTDQCVSRTIRILGCSAEKPAFKLFPGVGRI